MYKLACKTQPGEFLKINDDYQEIIKVCTTNADVKIRTLQGEYSYSNTNGVVISKVAINGNPR